MKTTKTKTSSQEISKGSRPFFGKGNDNTFVSDNGVSNGPFFNHVIQPKLTVNSPGDSYEHEADAMADKVMRMKMPENSDAFFTPSVSSVQRKADKDEKKKEKVHRKENSIGDVQGSPQLDNYVDSLGSSGQPLSESSRQFFEPRFGHDFSNVKVHTDSVAAKSAQSINALAYTTGSNIVFNQGQYSPQTETGQRLLAHELTHTVQQQGSVGLGMRRVIQRNPVDTSGGTWKADPYEKRQDIDSYGTALPKARGVDITLKFTPKDSVDAELIGLTQTANSILNNVPAAATNTVKDRSIKSADAKVIGGVSDEGTHIDRASAYNNPIYSVQTQPSTKLDDTNTSAGWGQNGQGKTNAHDKKDAVLIDKTTAPNAEKNSSQVYESTALVTQGGIQSQVGTYFGSVRWGWRTDSTGNNFDKIDLAVVSQGVPSSTFMKSASLWNASKDSTGANTVPLPTVDVKVTTAAITGQYPVGYIGPPLQIPAGARVQITRASAANTNGQIKVVDGTFIGEVLDVTPADMAHLAAERP